MLQLCLIFLLPLRNFSLAADLARIINKAFFMGEPRCLVGICKAYKDSRAEGVCKWSTAINVSCPGLVEHARTLRFVHRPRIRKLFMFFSFKVTKSPV